MLDINDKSVFKQAIREILVEDSQAHWGQPTNGIFLFLIPAFYCLYVGYNTENQSTGFWCVIGFIVFLSLAIGSTRRN